MLRALRARLAEDDVKLVLMVGDQMYSDMPVGQSLFEDDHFREVAPSGRSHICDCTPAEVRHLYQTRYRHFWSIPELQAIQSEHACYMIWDDHDIVDNWGSDATYREPAWRSIGEGARAACYDYQASRVLDEHEARHNFCYSVEHGCIAIHVMDLRSERSSNGGGLFSAVQIQSLRDFLERHADKAAIFIVLSVPVVHLPKWLCRAFKRLLRDNEDFSDRWSTIEHVRDRDRLFAMLHEHQHAYPDQRIVLLSGDIHIGCVHEICWEDGHRLHQFVSSGITHVVGRAIGIASKVLIALNRSLRAADGKLCASVRLLTGERGTARNPVDQLNFGIVELRRLDDSTIDVRFMLYGEKDGAPVCLYRSPPLHGAARG
jgi:alkaline phosphatase D